MPNGMLSNHSQQRAFDDAGSHGRCIVSRTIYELVGVPEGDEKALHATGHTTWDCPECGNDPEDCYGHEPTDLPEG